MPTYDYYRIFYYVAQYRSFTKAAAVMGNSQPNVTRCMNNLEHELSCTLFVRSRKGVSLTHEGKQLFEHVRAAYEQLRTAESELAGERGLRSGLISIGASEAALHLLLLDSLQKFHTNYPGVRLRISNHSTPQAIDALQRAFVDFAVVTSPIDLPRPLKKTFLFSFREVLLGGRAFAGLASAPRSLRDLRQYQMIGLGEGTATREFYKQYFADIGLPFQIDMEAASMDQILPMAEHDLGIGFFPEELAAPAVAAHRAVQIKITEPLPERSVCAVLDTSRQLSIAAKKLIQMLMERAADMTASARETGADKYKNQLDT